jgi:hypothetical protein
MHVGTRKRPITGTTPAGTGATYIVVESFEDDTEVRVIANGSVTFTVDSTVQNILYDATAQAAVNVGNPNDRYVAPASAVWANEIVSGSADAAATLTNLVFAIRINITAGTGSVTYTVAQG